jgi:hypothetical protein
VKRELISLSFLESLPASCIIQLSKDDLLSLLKEIKGQAESNDSKIEFVDPEAARKFFGGITAPTLRAIVRRYDLKNYSPTPGRTLYKLDELRAAAEQAALTRFTHKNSQYISA